LQGQNQDITYDSTVRQDIAGAVEQVLFAQFTLGNTPKYEYYFGASSAHLREFVTNAFQEIADGFDADNLRFLSAAQGTCSATNVFGTTVAFVPGASNTNVYLCPAYFNLDRFANPGTLSRVGALIHEIAHIAVGANRPLPNREYYFHDAIDLARSSPFLATLNADNYRLFATGPNAPPFVP
jgi:hypothetical protein